jgi:alpha-L-fucosidase 2
MQSVQAMKLKTTFCIVSVIFLSTFSAAQSHKPCTIWYAQPAIEWSSQALPIGNGRMGAMLFGGVEKEVIQFNEQSLWSGDNNWDGEYETGDHGFGSYRNFGEIVISFSDKNKADEYQRSLDIETGVHTTSFQQNNTKFTREAFASLSRPGNGFQIYGIEKRHAFRKNFFAFSTGDKNNFCKQQPGF